MLCLVCRNVSHSSRSSNSSESDNEDTEESVWRINDEQRAYYLNQFRILQPAEKGVVAGEFKESASCDRVPVLFIFEKILQ